ncbi:hypothetical protein ABZ920_00010 [Streptomyces sp. NPDC046831]|uniref:hypothetical protein n=1 Tax=Streptomyces sp. NPDC046831 TaxID=3154805 RepID=UPI0033D405E2
MEHSTTESGAPPSARGVGGLVELHDAVVVQLAPRGEHRYVAGPRHLHHPEHP